MNWTDFWKVCYEISDKVQLLYSKLLIKIYVILCPVTVFFVLNTFLFELRMNATLQINIPF